MRHSRGLYPRKYTLYTSHDDEFDPDPATPTQSSYEIIGGRGYVNCTDFLYPHIFLDTSADSASSFKHTLV